MHSRFRTYVGTIALLTSCATIASVSWSEDAAPNEEEQFLSRTHQVTFAGRRSGEAYFGPLGKLFIFQSERDEANPFYQMYVMDRDAGETWRVSPGAGKTTCGWIGPDGNHVLFASTHEDPDALQKQKEELDARASGQEKRYAWDYDEHYDLFATGIRGEEPSNLTKQLGYDAEGSWSPDGTRIAFTSNREAYTATLSDEQRVVFEKDKSYFCDIYVMNSDGSDLRRLTATPGYDGGPFFSPDGKRIVWRRFSEDGATAEIFTMNVDGTDVKQVTRLGAMSWAPFYHPSGDYIVFATNLQGFDNFELYAVDVEGKHDPVRVTYTGGFDGLPSFSPDGQTLAWTSGRTPDKTSQVFFSEWNDTAVRDALELGRVSSEASSGSSTSAVIATTPAITADDMRARVTYLASDALDGRLTGTEGERLATQYAADLFASLDLEPAGDDGSWFQSFEFTAGVSLGSGNRLTITQDGSEQQPSVDSEWRPLAFSKTGEIVPSPAVFAGYGIQAPEDKDQPAYDSYTHLDVAGKWVMVFRFMPEGITPERRQFFNRYASLRHKAMIARDRGAAGLIVVSGPNADVKEELVALRFDASLAGSSVAALAFSNGLADTLVKKAGKDLKTLQDSLDTGEPSIGFEIPGVAIGGNIDVQFEKRTGRNVLAKLSDQNEATTAIAVGAHIDHLGHGVGNQSMARGDEEGKIHYGADDNASGSAGLLEIAEYLTHEKTEGRLQLKHDILFAAWSGEELGILGSGHFTRLLAGEGEHARGLPASVSGYFNMDMIGRFKDQVLVHGVGSSSIWPLEIERANGPIGLSIAMQNDPYIPTDSTSFYGKGVPFLNAFTGLHGEYHTPRDTPDKIDYDTAARIAQFMARLTASLATREGAPDYKPMAEPEKSQTGVMRAYLGTIPDYSQTDAPGVKLSGVAKGGPADKAGILGGDSIVEVAGKRIENVYDYTYAIQALKVGEPVKIVVLRGEQRVETTVTPGSRE